MADSNDEAERRGERPDGRRRRPPPTIDAKAVEVPVQDTAGTPAEPPPSEAPASEAPASESAPETAAQPPSVEAAAATAVPEAATEAALPPTAESPEPASAEPVGTASGRGSVPSFAPAPRARTPWFAIFAAGTLGAGLAAAATGAAWVYYSPLEAHDTSGLSARVARLELQSQTPAEVAAATIPGMGNVPAAKLDELAARLAKLEAAPPPAPPPIAAAPVDTAKLDDLTARVQHLETAPQAAPASPEAASADTAGIKALDARMGTLEGSIKPLAQQIADLGHQAADTATAAHEARERAEAAAKTAADVKTADTDHDKQQQTAQKELATVGTRLAAVETLTKQVQDQVTESAAPKFDVPLRDALIAAGLRSAVERAQPFTAQFAAAKAAGIDPGMLAPLEPFAASGVPNPAELFRELGALIPEMLKASAPAEQDGGYLERLQAHAERLVRIRPAGDRPGDDAATVIGRIERDMARRDVAAVLAELEKLPAPAQAFAEPWRKKALAREAATKASEQLVTASFAKLGTAKQ